MPEPLPVAAAQPRIEPHDVEANARAHAAAVREAGLAWSSSPSSP